MKQSFLQRVLQFFSKLTGEGITEADYEHAQNVWREFGINNLGEYNDLYLNTDVVLLADVFEDFWETCIKHYGLDPGHYYTAPGLSWDAFLKHSTDASLKFPVLSRLILFS